MAKKYLYRHAFNIAIGSYVGIALILAKWFSVNLLPPCIWRSIFGYHCPGCGLTTAMLNLMSFDFIGAFRSNFLIFILLPVAFIYIYKDFKSFKKRYYQA